jgi:hypothetical protein
MYAVTETESSASSSTVLGQIKSLFFRGKRPRLQWMAIDTFDASGKPIKNRCIPTDQSETWSTLDYDSRGRLIAITSYYQGWATPSKPRAKEVFRLDSKGNIIDGEVYKAGKVVRSYKGSYIYDSRGNWVERHATYQEVASGKPPTTAVFYRKISYYDGSGK